MPEKSSLFHAYLMVDRVGFEPLTLEIIAIGSLWHTLADKLVVLYFAHFDFFAIFSRAAMSSSVSSILWSFISNILFLNSFCPLGNDQ